jgi:hypothetical protein
MPIAQKCGQKAFNWSDCRAQRTFSFGALQICNSSRRSPKAKKAARWGGFSQLGKSFGGARVGAPP